MQARVPLGTLSLSPAAGTVVGLIFVLTSAVYFSAYLHFFRLLAHITPI
jgi:hypothetical protein